MSVRPVRGRRANLPRILGAALLAAACSDSVGPERAGPGAPRFDVAASGGTAPSGSLGESGNSFVAAFTTNPHHGDAVVATFFWLGSSNIITTVTDQLANGTPVNNTYRLVEYVQSGGVSMATYVATNVQNYPDPNPDQGTRLMVRATLSTSVSDGGVMASAYSGVTGVSANAGRALDVAKRRQTATNAAKGRARSDGMGEGRRTGPPQRARMRPGAKEPNAAESDGAASESP